MIFGSANSFSLKRKTQTIYNFSLI